MLLKRAWSKQTSCSTSAEVSAAEMRLVISGGFKSPAGLLLLLVLLGGRGGRGGRAWQITLALTGLAKRGWQLTGACNIKQMSGSALQRSAVDSAAEEKPAS